MFRSERLLLREFSDEDFQAVHAYASDPDVVRYMTWGPNSEDETREFLRLAKSNAEMDPRVQFGLAIVRHASDELIGSIGLHVDGSNAMLGFCYARSAWGRGYATEAARVLLDFGFGSLGLHRIWADCDSENAASIRVLQKLGMRQEGHLRHDCQIRGEWRDTLVFAILDNEWGLTAGDDSAQDQV